MIALTQPPSSPRLRRKSTAADASMTSDELALSLLTFLADDLGCRLLQVVQGLTTDFPGELLERRQRRERSELLEKVLGEAHALGGGSCLERPMHLTGHIPNLHVWHVGNLITCKMHVRFRQSDCEAHRSLRPPARRRRRAAASGRHRARGCSPCRRCPSRGRRRDADACCAPPARRSHPRSGTCR